MVFRSRGQPCAATLMPLLNASERTAFLQNQFTERGVGTQARTLEFDSDAGQKGGEKGKRDNPRSRRERARSRRAQHSTSRAVGDFRKCQFKLICCAPIRTRFPALRTLPSRTYCTPRSRPTCCTFTAFPLYMKAELRDITKKPRNRASAVVICSAMPSAK